MYITTDMRSPFSPPPTGKGSGDLPMPSHTTLFFPTEHAQLPGQLTVGAAHGSLHKQHIVSVTQFSKEQVIILEHWGQAKRVHTGFAHGTLIN